MKKLTTEEFINKAKQVHGDKYNYSKVNYVYCYTDVCIICPEHGEFWQTPNNHLRGQDCPKCAGRFMNQEYFIEKARQVHGNKYDYSKVEYTNNFTNVCIICPEHGEFWQTPKKHLIGQGCPKCGREKVESSKRFTKEEFIEKARQVHGDKYDYSKVEYTNNFTKVCIICPEHGDFYQIPNSHLMGHGCPKCAKHYMNKEYFIEKARQIHGDRYDYSKVEYVNAKTKVCIICSDHGEFYQTTDSHLSGRGCPKCNMSHLERDVMLFLERHNVEYEYQKRFKWLGKMSLDFYIPKYNIAIECQGIQHFEPIKYFGGKSKLEKTQERDIKKKQLCEEHNIKLRYYK